MAPVIGFYFQEGCDREFAFTARGQMFMNTLSKELWVTYGSPVVSAPIPDRAFRLANVIVETGWAGKDVENVHSITREMVPYFKFFIRSEKFERGTLIQIVTAPTWSSSRFVSVPIVSTWNNAPTCCLWCGVKTWFEQKRPETGWLPTCCNYPFVLHDSVHSFARG